MSEEAAHRGIVHGKTIELDEDTGLPEGVPVYVVLRPLPVQEQGGEALKRSFGGWAEESSELDDYLAWSRKQRKASRSRIDP